MFCNDSPLYSFADVNKTILKKRLQQFFRPVLIIFTSIFLLQGCIEISEEVEIHDDQSGHLSFSVGIDKDGSLLSLLGGYVDLQFLDDLKDDLKYAAMILQASDGISHVRYGYKRQHATLSLEFDFADEQSLNRALYAMAGVKKTFLNPSIYKVKKNKFKRKNMSRWLKTLAKQEVEGHPDEILFDLVELKSLYILPDRIKSYSGENLKLSDEGYRVSSSVFVSDLLSGEVNTRVKIRY